MRPRYHFSRGILRLAEDFRIKKRHDVDRLMVSVMSFIVYGGVSGEGVGDCYDGIGAVPEESSRCAYDQSAMVRA